MNNLIIIPYVKKVKILDECFNCVKNHCDIVTNCSHYFCYECFKKTECDKCMLCEKPLKYLQPISL